MDHCVRVCKLEDLALPSERRDKTVCSDAVEQRRRILFPTLKLRSESSGYFKGRISGARVDSIELSRDLS